MKKLLILSLMVAGMILFAQKPQWSELGEGRICFTPFAFAPFPHVSRMNGHRWNETEFPYAGHYDDATVAVWVPGHYRPVKEIQVLIHFHGWGNQVSNVVNQFDLTGEITRSGKNVILICPQGPKNASDSTCGKMEEPGNFSLFLDEIQQFLQQEKIVPAGSHIQDVILSGHSGAYLVMSKILGNAQDSKKVRETYLFDATYGARESFADWIRKSSSHRLFSIFTDHLTPENMNILYQLQEKGNNSFRVIPDDLINDSFLKDHRVIFTHTKLGHNEVIHVRHYLEMLLRTSSRLKQL